MVTARPACIRGVSGQRQGMAGRPGVPQGCMQGVRQGAGIGRPRPGGHGGVGSSYCWADPVSGVSFAYFSNCRQETLWNNERFEVLSNLVHAAILD